MRNMWIFIPPTSLYLNSKQQLPCGLSRNLKGRSAGGIEGDNTFPSLMAACFLTPLFLAFLSVLTSIFRTPFYSIKRCRLTAGWEKGQYPDALLTRQTMDWSTRNKELVPYALNPRVKPLSTMKGQKERNTVSVIAFGRNVSSLLHDRQESGQDPTPLLRGFGLSSPNLLLNLS